MGIIFGLLAALGQAAAYVSIKKSFKELNPSIAFFFDACFGVLLWIPFAFLIGINFGQLQQVSGIALLSALLSEAFVFYALSKGHLSITGTIFAAYPIFTIFFSYILNNERLLPAQWLFITLTIMGIIIASLPKKLNRGEFKEKYYILWPILAAVAVGFSDTLSKGVIDRTSAGTFLLALSFAQIPVAVGYLLFAKQSLRQFEIALQEFNKYKLAILGSLLNIVATLFLWLAYSGTLASIASPLTAAYPAIIIVLSMIFLKERPSRLEFIGLGLTILGIIGISF